MWIASLLYVALLSMVSLYFLFLVHLHTVTYLVYSPTLLLHFSSYFHSFISLPLPLDFRFCQKLFLIWNHCWKWVSCRTHSHFWWHMPHMYHELVPTSSAETRVHARFLPCRLMIWFHIGNIFAKLSYKIHIITQSSPLLLSYPLSIYLLCIFHMSN